MDRIREARRTSLVSSNGLSRRRHKITGLRDSPEEYGRMELQETVRLLDRSRVRKNGRDMDRDRELLSRNKRRRADKYVQGTNGEEGGDNTDDSFDNDEDYYDEEDGRVAPMLPSNHPSTSSSISNHNHRRSLEPARVVRSSPALRVVEEMVGAPVPRKARSASIKRSHEYCNSGSGGFREDQNHRRASTSPASGSADGVPPCSSTISVRKKMRQIGPMTRPPKVSSRLSSSSQAQDDIEMEVAEALYDLMKQSKAQSCNKQERTTENSTKELDSNDRNDNETKSVGSPVASVQITSLSPNLPQENSSTSIPLLDAGSKRKRPEDAKDEEGSVAISVQKCSSITVIKADIEQQRKSETGISSPKLEKVPCEAMVAEPLELMKNEAAEIVEDSNHATLESGKAARAITKEEVVALSCAKLDVDNPVNSTVTKANSTMTNGEIRFEIDLMTSPPMPSSPKRDGLVHDESDTTKIMSQDVEMKNEIVAKVEDKVEQILKREVSATGSDKLHQIQKQQNKSKAILEDKFAPSCSLPLPIPVADCQGNIPLLGYMPPLQTVTPMDESTRSSTASQPSHFLLSQPRPKRCATHHCIARNINYHQQLTKINHVWPAAAGPTSLYGAKPYNLNVMPSVHNMILGSQLQGGFPGGQALATIPGLSGEDKSSELANILDATQAKQLVLQQAPQPVPAGSLLHGPTFVFPLSQHQAAVAAKTSQSVTLKSAPSINNASLPNNSARGTPVTSSSFPTTAVSFNYPNFPANETPPYMAILHNNGYPFPISTHIGMPPPAKGGSHPPVVPSFNGSFYSSPMFHPSQSQQQLPHSQPLIQSNLQNTSISGGLVSSHKQSQSQQQKGVKVSGNSFLTSTNMQLQQPQKQDVSLSHSSRKPDAEMVRQDHILVADSRLSNTQKSNYGQNLVVPIQPMKFALTPATMGSGGGSSHGEQQHKGSKGGDELVPPQAFTFSFPSANAASSALNFSSMAQNPAIFQMLPDMAHHRYKIGPAAQEAHKENFLMSETKTGADSTNTGDGRKGMLGKTPTIAGQSFAFSESGCLDPSASSVMGTTVFDSSVRTLSFISSSGTGNQPSRSSSTAITTASISVKPPNYQQQQQPIQLQRQHAKQQQMNQQLVETAKVKAQTSSSQLSSSVAANLPNNTTVFPQNTNSSSQSPQWRNLARHPACQLTSPSLAEWTSSKNPPQQQLTPISFGGSPNSVTAAQGQQIAIDHQSVFPLAAGSPPNSSISKNSGCSLKSASKVNNGRPAIPALPSQQTESSSNGLSQKSSPVCRRNVPSILSTCPSQLSELKY